MSEAHAADSGASGSDADTGGAEVRSSAANLFDLRNVIAILFLGYGLVLLVVGIADTTEGDLAKAGGIHLNIWTGATMLATAVFFGLWARLRPLIPPTAEELAEAGNGPGGH
jgi:hypothetical protein